MRDVIYECSHKGIENNLNSFPMRSLPKMLGPFQLWGDTWYQNKTVQSKPQILNDLLNICNISIVGKGLAN